MSAHNGLIWFEYKSILYIKIITINCFRQYTIDIIISNFLVMLNHSLLNLLKKSRICVYFLLITAAKYLSEAYLCTVEKSIQPGYSRRVSAEIICLVLFKAYFISSFWIINSTLGKLATSVRESRK